ncbi:MAG TPA: nitrate reductase molybdenum cofactor assembly chaperone [Anaerolineales bacterium]|nr:nitrate reductase molybdenum cofactor assembly chaperone [Anaerolineales bacterium]
MVKDSTSSLFDLFAALLEYPSPETVGQAQDCFEQLKPTHVEAAEALEKFVRRLDQLSLEKMRELYTITFDMQPVCYPYVGYHLFGESYKRGAFMAQLNEAYHAFDYSAGQELPDYLAVILRFLGLDATHRSGEFCQTLLSHGVQPALEKMLKVFNEDSENPYEGLLSALRLFLVPTPEKELTHA